MGEGNSKIHPKFQAEPGEYKFAPTKPEELKLAQGAVGRRGPGATGVNDTLFVTTTHQQTAAPQPMLVLYIFHKKHYLTPEDFLKQAAHWHEVQLKEVDCYLDAIRVQKKFYLDWTNPPGVMQGITARTVQGWNFVRGYASELYNRAISEADQLDEELRHAPKPDPEEFDKLEQRANAVLDKLKPKTLDYELMNQAGLELQLIWADLQKLLHAIDRFRGKAVDRAGDLLAVAETTENLAFSTLNVAPTIMFMDPVREALWKLGVLLLRSGARGAGTWTASDRAGFDDFLRGAVEVFRAQAPAVLADVVCGFLRGMKNPKAKKAVEIVIREFIGFMADVLDILHDPARENMQLTDDDWNRLLRQRAVSLVGVVTGLLLPHDPALDSLTKERAAAVAEAIVNSVAVKVNQAYEKHKADPGKTVLQYVVEDLPGLLWAIIENALLGMISKSAARMGHETSQQTSGNRTNFKESWAIAKEQTKPVRKGFVKGKMDNVERAWAQASRRIPPLSPENYGKAWSQTHLDHETASRYRRWADEVKKFVVFRVPSTDFKEFRLDRDHAVWPKPLPVKYKSAKISGGFSEGDHRLGRVAVLEADVQSKGWKSQVHDLVAKTKGAMVAPDGVIFHPDQLIQLAGKSPEQSQKLAEAHALLRKMYAEVDQLHKSGNDAEAEKIIQLNTPEAKKHWEAKLGESEYAKVASVLDEQSKGERIGFHADIDLVEVGEEANGKRVSLGGAGRSDTANASGDPSEMSQAEKKKIGDANRQGFNDQIDEFTGDAVQIKRTAQPNVVEQGLFKKPGFTPIMSDSEIDDAVKLHQHGGASDAIIVKPDGSMMNTPVGDVGVVASGDRLWVINPEYLLQAHGRKSGGNSIGGNQAVPTDAASQNDRARMKMSPDLERLLQIHGEELRTGKLGIGKFGADLEREYDMLVQQEITILVDRRIVPKDSKRDGNFYFPSLAANINPSQADMGLPRGQKPSNSTLYYTHGPNYQGKKVVPITLKEIKEVAPTNTATTTGEVVINATPVDRADVEAAMIFRWLRTDETLVGKAFGTLSADEAKKIMQTYSTVVAVSKSGRNIVIASMGAGRSTLRCIADMVQTKEALGTPAVSNAILWYEIFGDRAPATCEGILDRLENVDAAEAAELRELPGPKATTFASRKGERIVALAAGDLAYTYSPDPDETEYNAFALTDVWEDRAELRLIRRKASIDKRPVGVFPGGLVYLPPDTPLPPEARRAPEDFLKSIETHADGPRAAAARTALAELKVWKKGSTKEDDANIQGVLKDYWATGVGNTAGYTMKSAWSAAFISWVMKQSGAGGSDFAYAINHGTYVAAARENRYSNSSNPFYAYKPTEVPLRVGDILVRRYDKSKSTDFDSIEGGDHGAGYHGDIITSLSSGKVEMVGGNVGDSVTRRTSKVNDKGFVVESGEDFVAIVRVHP